MRKSLGAVMASRASRRVPGSVLLIVGVCSLTALTGCGRAADPSASRTPRESKNAASSAAPATSAPEPAACRRVREAETQDLPGKVLGRCIDAYITASNSVHRRVVSDGPGASKDLIEWQVKPFQLFAKSSDGTQLIILGERAWQRSKGKWAEAKQGSTNPDESIAYATYLVTRRTHEPGYHEGYLAQAGTWKFSRSQLLRVPDSTEQVKTRKYVATSAFTPLGMGVRVTAAAIWVDKNGALIKAETVAELGGFSAREVETYYDYGLPVTVPSAPRG